MLTYITILIVFCLLIQTVRIIKLKRKIKSKPNTDDDANINKFDIYRTIFDNSPFYYFLINSKVEVLLTNYYTLNPKAPDSAVKVLGNVLSCKNACDSGHCGTSPNCKFCMIRANLVNAFQTGRNFKNVETSLNIYENDGSLNKIDVNVTGTMLNINNKKLQLVSVNDITIYKSSQRRLLSMEYQRNFIKRRAAIVQRLANASNEEELKYELKKIFHFKSNLKEEMEKLINITEVDSHTLLQNVEIACSDDDKYKVLKDYLRNKCQTFQAKTIEEQITLYLNKHIDTVIITSDIDFNDANNFVSAIRCTNDNIPILRILNVGDNIAGEYTKILFNPITPIQLNEELKNLSIKREIDIK